jgi:hypothetical protein
VSPFLAVSALTGMVLFFLVRRNTIGAPHLRQGIM